MNQAAVPGGGTQVLLYPGTNIARVQGPLLQPGAPYPGLAQPPIKLRPPGHRRSPAGLALQPPAQTPVKPPVRTAETSAPAPVLPASPTPAARSTRAPVTAAPAPAEAAPPARGIPFALTPTSPNIVMGRIGSHGGLAARQAPPASAPPPAPPHNQTATLEPAKPARTGPSAAEAADREHLTKRTQIVFAAGATDPAPASMPELKALAADLSHALGNGTARVQLEAYGGAPGDKSSDARRLSLKRALAVRSLLIDNGVPAERIDVRALGGASDGGAPDRVDVFVRAG